MNAHLFPRRKAPRPGIRALEKLMQRRSVDLAGPRWAPSTRACVGRDGEASPVEHPAGGRSSWSVPDLDDRSALTLMITHGPAHKATRSIRPRPSMVEQRIHRGDRDQYRLEGHELDRLHLGWP